MMTDQPRDWDRELAEIDKVIAKQGGAPPRRRRGRRRRPPRTGCRRRSAPAAGPARWRSPGSGCCARAGDRPGAALWPYPARVRAAALLLPRRGGRDRAGRPARRARQLGPPARVRPLLSLLVMLLGGRGRRCARRCRAWATPRRAGPGCVRPRRPRRRRRRPAPSGTAPVGSAARSRHRSRAGTVDSAPAAQHRDAAVAHRHSPPRTHSGMAKTFRNFIGGEWVAPANGAYFENRNPADTDDLIGRFPDSDAARRRGGRPLGQARLRPLVAHARAGRGATSCAGWAICWSSARRPSPTR